MKPLHIAIASTTSKPGAVGENLLQIAGFVDQAHCDGASLLLTPELSVSGYGSYPEVLATAEQAGSGPIFAELAKRSRMSGVVICAGFVEAWCDKRYLSHYVVYPDGAFVVQRKNRVMVNEQPLDSACAVTPEFITFTVHDVRCAIAICADSGITGLDDILSEMNVELLLVPTGAGGEREDRVTTGDLRVDKGREKYLHWLERVFFPGPEVGRCMKYRRALAAVNLCGFDGQRHYHIGHGSIITPMGEVAALIHGLPNLDRQRPMYTHATVDVEDSL